MIQIEWIDREGHEQTVRADFIKLWKAFGGGREHPDGTVIEACRDGIGILQLDADDRIGAVYIREVK
jgi:hypothetical protein